ncbi:MAG: DNA-processing protein DprA [Bradyrhizobiaceae bacterium]|nr:DNA-processing protein DprA [Bradyrhizobiaceae bacterium]
MHSWTPTEIVALSRLGKLSNAERIALVETHHDWKGALHSLGAMEMDAKELADTILADASKAGVQVMTVWDEEYPARLRGLEQPPMVIYVLGTLPDITNPTIAVVGTRTCTVAYGKPATEQLVKRWVNAGCVIVSGLASGIDMLAHEACIKASGQTIAVVASGIDRISPNTAQRMVQRIVQMGGAVVSEHPCHVAALPPYFPARNRIIAGLSDAVVVVESKATGGSLITAEFARKQLTPVWAVPGPITSSRSVGTNQLIARGEARILTSADELLSATFGMHDPVPTSARAKSPCQATELLGANPFTVEHAAACWKCAVSQAMVRLFDLELDGKIQHLPGGMYVVI